MGRRAPWRSRLTRVFLIDTNVLIDIAMDAPDWADWSSEALSSAAHRGPALINPIIYAEVSVAFERPDVLDDALDRLRIVRAPLPYAAGFLAGRAFATYRRAGGLKRSPLSDFFIGAHALVEDLTVITRDPRPFRTYFPSLAVVAP